MEARQVLRQGRQEMRHLVMAGIARRKGAAMHTVTHQVLDRCTDNDRIRGADSDQDTIVRAILLRRAQLLPTIDRRLVELSIAGHTIRELARMLGRHPGSISRRLNALRHRLADETVAALADHWADLPDHYRRIGISRYILGRPVRVLARQFALTQSEIIEIIGYLRAWAMLRRHS